MPHAPDDLAERHVPLRCVNLVQDPHLVAPVAGDAQIPARKRGERFDQGFWAVGSGWSPFERQCRTGGLRAGIVLPPGTWLPGAIERNAGAAYTLAVGFSVATLLASFGDAAERANAVDGLNAMVHRTGYALTPVT